jgi:hypothetical protein
MQSGLLAFPKGREAQLDNNDPERNSEQRYCRKLPEQAPNRFTSLFGIDKEVLVILMTTRAHTGKRLAPGEPDQ